MPDKLLRQVLGQSQHLHELMKQFSEQLSIDAPGALESAPPSDPRQGVTGASDKNVAQANRHRWMLAVMFVDLDNFKVINDTYGHHSGDAILKMVALRLSHCAPHRGYGQPLIAAKILKAIEAPSAVAVGTDGVELSMKASIGISVFPKDGATGAELIRRADEAMYAAKQSGSGFAFAH